MILELKDIRLSFSNAKKERFDLLSGVSLEIPAGGVTALIGGNGAGKTTLFNVISGFQNSFSGEVWFEGRNISHLPPYQISRMGIGRLFQGKQLMGGLSILENMQIASADRTGEFPFSYLVIPAKLKRVEAEKKAQAVDILETLFGKQCKYIDMLDQPAGNLSYGEQRMIAIARLLMGENRLLLLDEPTAGVNPRYNETIAHIIREMADKKGLSVLMIEHNMHFVRDVASRCAFLDEGQISVYGPTEEVIDNSAVRSSYLGL